MVYSVFCVINFIGTKYKLMHMLNRKKYCSARDFCITTLRYIAINVVMSFNEK